MRICGVRPVADVDVGVLTATMNRLLIVLLLALTMSNSHAWSDASIDAVGGDKVAHALAGLAVTALVYTFTDATVGQSFAIGVGVGVAKELYDSQPCGSGFDGFDLMDTGVGAFASGFAVQHLEHIGIGVKYQYAF